MGFFDAYLPVLAFASLFRDDPHLHQTPYETVHTDIQTLLARARRECRSLAVRLPALASDAEFAVCAFADEALLVTPWEGAGEWARKTLQFSVFKETNAGVTFYSRLEALLRNRAAYQGCAGVPEGAYAYGQGAMPGHGYGQMPGQGYGAIAQQYPAQYQAQYQAQYPASHPASHPAPHPAQGFGGVQVTSVNALPLSMAPHAAHAPDAYAQPAGHMYGSGPAHTPGSYAPGAYAPGSYDSPAQNAPPAHEFELGASSSIYTGQSAFAHLAAKSPVTGLPASTVGLVDQPYVGSAQAPPAAAPGAWQRGIAGLGALPFPGKAAPRETAKAAEPAQEQKHNLFSPHEETLALYAAALTMGFTGQYYSEDARQKLRALTLESIDGAIAGRIAKTETLITPEAYYMPKTTARSRRLSPVAVGVLFAIPAFITAAMYFVYDSLISEHAAALLRILHI